MKLSTSSNFKKEYFTWKLYAEIRDVIFFHLFQIPEEPKNLQKCGMSTIETPHPWQAQVKVSKNRISKHVCSGVILTERHIMTSASCVVDNPIKHYIVVVGQNDLDELDEWEEEYSVQRLVIHV